MFAEDLPRKKARIEIIPMIDVMMFLLVFFVLISINVIPALGIKTTLPTSSTAEEVKVVTNVVVTLAKTGELQVNGKTVAAPKDLPAAIHALEKPDSKMVIIVNGDAAVEMQRLIDVMDALKSGGFDSFAIATKKK